MPTATHTRTGACLCGKVTLTAHQAQSHIYACHCSMCQTWGGGPALSLDGGTDVTFDGQALIQTYPSSEWAERGFCSCCGTHLYYRLKQHNQYFIPAGLFTDKSNFSFTSQIYIDCKPDYYTFSEHTQNLTEAEVIALYSSTEND